MSSLNFETALSESGDISNKADDFWALLALRDKWKIASGIPFAVDVFAELYKISKAPGLAVNYGIALFEDNKFEEAEYILRKILEDHPDSPSHPDYGHTLSVYYSWSLGRIDQGSAARFLLDRISKGDAKLLDVFFHDFLTVATKEHLVKIQASDNKISVSPSNFRAVYDKLSASNSLGMLDEFLPILGNASELARERLLADIVYGFADQSTWGANVDDLLLERRLSPSDSYFIALQSVERLPREAAEALIDRLSNQGDNYWACDRVGAAFLEATGRRMGAIERHHIASLKEYRTLGKDISFRKVPRSDVQISCIAISFNDKPLVAHFCRAIMPHCNEIVVNDGGSTDGTIEEFERIAAEANFPIRVIRDVQHGNRDRTIFNKEGYRDKGLGGVLAFDADRRRSMTLAAAKHEYILMADLDDFFPAYPNLRTLVAGAYGVEHFTGARLETLSQQAFTVLQLGNIQGAPTLFRRHPEHVYAGVSADDEYLARMDKPLGEWASMQMQESLTFCFNYWHLKFYLDGRHLASLEHLLGPKHSVSPRFDRPSFDCIPTKQFQPDVIATVPINPVQEEADITAPAVVSKPIPFSTARIALLGNCQASALASVLYRVKGVSVQFIVDVNGEGSDFYKRNFHGVVNLDQVDFCFSQPLSDNFGKISSDELRRKYGNRYKQYTNLYFTGFHPDLTYYGDRNVRLQSAMGDYNSKIALISYLQGLSIDETTRRFNDDTYRKLAYYQQFEASRDELLRRDEANDVRFAADFFTLAKRFLPLYTVNHPTAAALASLATMIVQATGLEANSIDTDLVKNPLTEGSVWPVYPEVSTALGLAYPGSTMFYPGFNEDRPPMSLREFVAITFERYDGFGNRKVLDMPSSAEWAQIEI